MDPIKLEQGIDFIAGHDQILTLLNSDGATGLKITMGVTSEGKIVVVAQAVFVNAQTNTMEPKSDLHILCPIPPNCPRIEACAKNVASLLSGPGLSQFLKANEVNTYLSR